MSLQTLSIGVFFIAFVISCVLIFYYEPLITAPKIPMQWGINGKPTWYAPRLIGLWIFPFFMFFIGGILVVAAASAGADGATVWYSVILNALLMLGVQWWHFNAVVRWVAKQ